MSIELVTGHAGAAHVTSAQDGRLNAAAWGVGKYVLPLQAEFAITVDSANRVTIATGDAMMEGRHITSESPTELAVDSGTQGMKRNDLVAIAYSKDGNGVESAELMIIKGAETSSTAEDPALPPGSILAGDTTCVMALWRLPIDGIAVGNPVQLFSMATELANDDNATYTLGYTASSRVLKLTGAGGGASSQVTLPAASSDGFGLVKVGSGITNSSGAISVPTANSTRNGLMTAAQAANLTALRPPAVNDNAMGWGYMNASKELWMYFPVAATGFARATGVRTGALDISCDGGHYVPDVAVFNGTGTLLNGGTVLQISTSLSGLASAQVPPARHALVVYTSRLYANFE